MNVADRIVEFLYEQGIRHVFTVSGGGSIFMCDALAKSSAEGKLAYICTHHEQAAGYAAECYARIRGLGVTLVTSGPGGTNAVSAVAASWLDSVPHIFISGQAFLAQTIGQAPTKGLRQLGVQEINIIDIVKPITKYAVMVKYASQIDKILERALKHATTGRPGPVWLDLPGDIQNAPYR